MFGSLRDGDVPVRRVLGFFRHGMIVFDEEVAYVVFHRELTFTFGVIPVKVNTSKFGTIPIMSTHDGSKQQLSQDAGIIEAGARVSIW